VKLIDTHCHINFDSYDEDRDAVIERAAEAGVSRIIIPAVDLKTSQEIVEMVKAYPNLYGAVGIHPNSTAAFESGWIDRLSEIAAEVKIAAIGEIGLDYHWDESPKTKQFEGFEAQLALAARLELPVIIHNRDTGELGKRLTPKPERSPRGYAFVLGASRSGGARAESGFLPGIHRADYL
jgi:TatD DNase family protein